MQFLTSLLGGGENTLLVAVFALGIVIVLIVLGVWLLKVLSNFTSNATRNPRQRLSVVERIAIDGRRQVLILRRDNVEHVVMTGGPADLVIESGIPVELPQRPAMRRPAANTDGGRAAGSPPRAANETTVTPAAAETVKLIDKPAEVRRGPSLRNTGLLRAASRLRSTDAHTEKPAPESDDSATEARVEIIGNPRFGDG
ncbi:MAG: procollagen, type alpha 3, partial [Devosia sp.]|nr:procollagen, type alpha 3 [Devosia sp.]